MSTSHVYNTPKLSILSRGLVLVLALGLLSACVSLSAPIGLPAVDLRPTSQPTPPPVDAPLLPPDERVTTWDLPGQPDIAAMRENIVTVWQANELEFDLGYPVQGFSPDPVYPRLFIRDTSTLLTGASYFYPAERLKWSVEAFLRQQYDQTTVSSEDGWQAGFGAISATVGPDRFVDKATAVSDEETHLIHAAYVVYRVNGGANWLKQEINGLPVITRLNAAGNWLLNHRYDAATGLIKRDHTTDWGDVRFQPTTGNPTDLVPADVVWTASIYDQALAYRAWRELAELNLAAGDEATTQTWAVAADHLRQAANTYLWQPERGFYRTHIHLTMLWHNFDETAMVSIANAVAMVCGLSDATQNESIVTALEQARLKSGSPKPGVTLYPPYPPGFFAISSLHGGPAYQNGGVWDWWGAWQVLAEFESGYSDLARAHLRQTAADWAKHPGQIFEWQEARTMAGRGGDRYASAAGTYAQTIIEGLYGVRLSVDQLALSPRLGDWPGSINAHQPASGLWLRYTYRPATNWLALVYDTNYQGATFPLQFLVPPGFNPTQVWLDHTSLDWTPLAVGQDDYLAADLPTGQHLLVIEGNRW